MKQSAANGKANMTISSKVDVTGGKPKSSGGFKAVTTPAFSAPKAIGAPKDVTENQNCKETKINLGSTNPGKENKIGK